MSDVTCTTIDGDPNYDGGEPLRVNVDVKILADPRFRLLVFRLKEGVPHVLGRLVMAWMAGYGFKSPILRKEEVDASAELSGFAEALVAVGLADVQTDAEMVRLRGVAERIPYLQSAEERGRAGGIASGVSRRTKKSSAIDIDSVSESNDIEANAEANPYQPQEKQDDRSCCFVSANPPSPSPSPSHNTSTPAARSDRVSVGDLEAVYALFPRKLGKTRGMAKARATIRTKEDLARFTTATKNYAALVRREGTEDRFIKHWVTFVNCWQDYEGMESKPAPVAHPSHAPGRPTPPPPPSERIGLAGARELIGKLSWLPGMSDPHGTPVPDKGRS